MTPSCWPPARGTPTSATTTGSRWLRASRPWKTRWRSADACCWPTSWPSGSATRPSSARWSPRWWAASGRARGCAAVHTGVGAGCGRPAVELAGALAEISRETIARDFRVIDPTQARIVLLEGGPRILAGFPEPLPERAREALTRIGVEVRTGAMVTRVTPDAVWLGGEQIRARTVLWAAGVAASPLTRSLGVPLDRAGRVQVERDLSIPGHPEAFAIGDMATLLDEHGQPLPGLAPVAIQQGRAVAANVLHRLAGAPTRPLRYPDKGTMGTIG